MPDFGSFRGFGEKLAQGQTPTQLGKIGAESFGYDSDAQAFFDRVTTAGGTLTGQEQTAVNQLVIDMKAAGVWTPMRAIYPMVGSSAAACAQNLISSSFTGTFNGGWSYASTGATPNGSTGFFNTNLNLFNSFGATFNNHFSVYYRTQNYNFEKIGAAGSNFYDMISTHINYSDSSGYTYNDNLGRNIELNINYGNSAAHHISSILSNTSLKMFRNGVLKISGNANNSAVQPSLNFYFGGLNNQNFFSSPSNREMSFGSIGDGLTDTQSADFYTAVQAFQTTLGRQV